MEIGDVAYPLQQLQEPGKFYPICPFATADIRIRW